MSFQIFSARVRTEVALSVGKGINKDFGLLRSAAKELDYSDMGGVEKA